MVNIAHEIECSKGVSPVLDTGSGGVACPGFVVGKRQRLAQIESELSSRFALLFFLLLSVCQLFMFDLGALA